LKMRWNHYYLKSLKKTSHKAWNEKKYDENKKEKEIKPFPYIVHMEVLIYISSTNPP
jgi:hypothetical protein